MKSYAVLILLATLSACGGGGSSSGGMDDSSRFDGVYTGTSEIVINGIGPNVSNDTITVNGTATVTIENGSIVFINNDGERFEDQIESNGEFSGTDTFFGVFGSAEEGSFLESCEGTATWQGIVVPPTITYTIEQTGTCIGGGETIVVNVTTNVTATQ